MAEQFIGIFDTGRLVMAHRNALAVLHPVWSEIQLRVEAKRVVDAMSYDAKIAAIALLP